MIDAFIAEILESLKSHPNLVIVATPGAGKTTRVPPALVKSGLAKKVVMLEPRRIAARAAASRIAAEQNWRMGQEVGYQVRFESTIGAQTQLQILTEALLNRRLQSDPDLSDVGAVILDEFHERHWHSDLALGLLRELQSLSRPDLHLIVMSATMEAESVAKFLGDCPIIEVRSPQFPVEIEYSKKSQSLVVPQMLKHTQEFLREITQGKQRRLGDVLVFLPGAGEIRACYRELETTAVQAGFDLIALHGSLSLDEQERSLKKSEKPKIILATNIAETSLTIDGVATVVDTGLVRQIQSSEMGFERLELSRISRASAVQRAGRSGRQGPGLCYRLWNKMDEATMPAFAVAEIFRMDLSEAVLLLASMGISNPQQFTWYEKPKESALDQAFRLLQFLGALNKNGTLSENGEKLTRLPLAPRLAHLVSQGAQMNLLNEAVALAALLSERDVLTKPELFRSLSNTESDPLLRLMILQDWQKMGREGLDTFTIRNIQRVIEHLLPLTRRIFSQPKTASTKGPPQDEQLKRLLLLTFPDRVARRRQSKSLQARIMGGKGLELSPRSSLETADLFVVIEAFEQEYHHQSKLVVTQASEIKAEWLEEYFPAQISRQTQLLTDTAGERVLQQTARAYADVPLESPKESRPDPGAAHPQLLALALERWPQILAAQPEAQGWLDRLEFLREQMPQESWPEMTQEKITELLSQLTWGETRLSEVRAKTLLDYLPLLLNEKQKTLLQREAPSHLTVPSGSRLSIQYPKARAPYLEVRIQEIFGWPSSPSLAAGRVQLVLHLLGPNFRPVQVTSDLHSFWQNGYKEVRKELRARYPKHSWPDDPLTAPAVAKGRRK